MTLRYTTHHMQGGIHPPEQKTLSNTVPIRQAAVPKTLVLPLGQHVGEEALATVSVGERVLRGQCIAVANSQTSAAVHASSSGIITAITPHPTTHPSGLPATCIIIETDGEDAWHPRARPKTPNTQFDADTPEKLRQRITAAGIVGLGGAGFPTAAKIASEHPIHTLILNAVECEPYITSDDLSVRERGEAILIGCHWLARLTGARKVLIGIEDNKPEAITILKNAIRQHMSRHGNAVIFQIIVVHTKYPSGGEKQLIQLLTGLEVPHGKLPAHLGMLCINVGTSYAVYQALSCGMPLTSRVTTVTGLAVSAHARGNYEVRLGTRVKDLLTALAVDWSMVDRLIHGGPMMGYTLHSADAPLVKVSNCLIAAPFSELPHPKPEQPCIRCGLCAEVCPASLLPQQLYWYAKAEDEAGMSREHLMDCIECGACAYVCPSHIPLVQYYRFGKGQMRQHALEKRKSDQARVRFENRQARIDREQAERESKRQARLRTATPKAKNATPAITPAFSEQSSENIPSTPLAQANTKQLPPPQDAPVQPLIASDQPSTTERMTHAATEPQNEHTLLITTPPAMPAALPIDQLPEKDQFAPLEDEQVQSLKNAYLKAHKRWQDAQNALTKMEKQQAGPDPNHPEQGKANPELERYQKKIAALKAQADALQAQWLLAKNTGAPEQP